MKDIPMFTTEYGIASLALGEIPYKGEAYVQIRTVVPGQLERLLEECIAFCRACGADRIDAAEAEGLEQYPLRTVIYEMRGSARQDGEQANLWPVTEETLERWRSIANEKLSAVDHAATITAAEGKKLLSSGGAYFVHENGQLLGIGLLQGEELRLVAATQKGAGALVLRTLLSTTGCDRVRLEVASTNERAIRLYERMGFAKTAEIRRWYRIFG